MKRISKMMLAAVASVALAAPVFAWDFSASGTATGTYNNTSTKANSVSGTKASTIGTKVSSAGSSLTLASSHTDGAKTASLTYVLDWDGNLDETITVSGSNKVGNWTASGSVAYTPRNLGCSNAASAYYIMSDNGSNYTSDDNGTLVSATTGATACAGTQTGEDATSVTVTDGTMTIILGEAAHLSGQNVSTSSTASGAISMDGQDEDLGAGAFVDSFHGVSLGYKISDTMSATVAYQLSGDASDMMGAGEYLDGETATTHTTSGVGVSFSGTFGPATVGITQASASTADQTGDSATAGLLSTTMSTMGLGVKIDLGDIDPFISYGTYTGSAGSTANKAVEHTHTASEFGLTYALGADTVILYVGNAEDKYSTTDKATTKSGMEVGYNTTVGPASLSIGYGTQSKADADKTDGCGGGAAVTGGSATSCDGYSMTDIEVGLSFSF